MTPRPFFLERYFARLEFSTPYLLASSDCESLRMTELLEAADHRDRAAWQDLKLAYTESAGLPELRTLIAGHYQWLAAEHVVTAAPEEAIYILARTLFQPGDRIIVTFPGYQSLYELALAAGCRIERWTPDETPQGWRFDPTRLRELAKGKVRAIVANFPHNPTGALPTHSEWKEIVACAENAGAHLVCDEMYRGLEYRAEDRLLPAAVASERGVSIAGLSKAYGLPGLRSGWIAARDRKALRAIQAYKDYTTICASAPGEILSVIALKNSERLQERCRGIIAANRPLVEEFREKRSKRFAWRAPKAGPIAFARLNSGSALKFCERAASEAGVMLAPSPIFEAGDSHFRIGFGRLNLPEALAALDNFMQVDLG